MERQKFNNLKCNVMAHDKWVSFGYNWQRRGNENKIFISDERTNYMKYITAEMNSAKTVFEFLNMNT